MCIVSMNGNVYHRKGCCYANRIKTRYLLEFNIGEAESHGYRECKLCGSFSYYYKLQEHNILHYCLNHYMQYAFRNNALYIQTYVGNWRIIKSGRDGLLRLLHKNGELDDRELWNHLSVEYHRQADVAASGSVMKYLEYIYNHDRYKKIAVENYKKLPQDKKKQKKYYKSAKNRDRRAKKRHLMNLFEQLERENSDYRQLSIVGMEG